MQLREELLGQWLTLVSHAGAESAGRALLERWAEPHRRYHDLTHLRDVLTHVDELAAAADDAGAVRLAAFFHDAVYEIGAVDNEERSAVLATRVLTELAVGTNRARQVARLVRATVDHLPTGVDDADAGVLCDADLAILGAEPAAYTAYAARVRAEYRTVPEAAFRRGRAEILHALIARPRLFVTASGQFRWEATARRNITAELELLQSAQSTS